MRFFQYPRILIYASTILCMTWMGSPVLADTFVLQPDFEGEDMFVRSRDGDVAGGYDRPVLEVGGWSDYYNVYIRFDLSEMPTGATSAVIKLYCYDYFDDPKWGPPPDIALLRVTSDWDETTTVWGNQPDTIYQEQLDAPTEKGWYSIDVTELYNQWTDGSAENFGIALMPVQTDNRFALFRSSDYLDDPTLRPKLVVESTPEPTAILQDTVIELNEIDVFDFKNLNMQNALTNKIMAAIALIADGQYEEARNKLLKDVMRKTDGCIEEGRPDANDWIYDCVSQEAIYNLVNDAAMAIEGY